MTRRVLITGASRGIGRAIALEMARQGYEVTLHYHSRHEEALKCQSEIEKLGGKVQCLPFDVTDGENARVILGKDLQANGPYYGVIYNCGITQDAMFPNLDSQSWTSVIDTNLNGFFHVVQPLVMPMIRARQGGRIIAMTSVSGLIGNMGQSNYAASKAGLIGVVKSLAVELAKREITVNAIAPGLIETEMIEGVNLEHVLKTIPLKRLGRPEEVAKLASFLMSDHASYITRQVFSINGGMF